MTTIAHLKPTTIEGIKRLGNRLKKTDSLPLARALDIAAVQAGHTDYQSALKSLSADGKSEILWNNARLTAIFVHEGTTQSVVTHIRLRQNLHDIATVEQLSLNAFIGNAVILANDHIRMSAGRVSKTHAYKMLSRLGRLLQFIDATGLIPTGASLPLPDGSWGWGILPDFNHEAAWVHPVSGLMMVMDQPYGDNANSSEIYKERIAAAHKRGLTVTRMSWGSIHADESGTVMDIISVPGAGYNAGDVKCDLDTADPPLRTDNGVWTAYEGDHCEPTPGEIAGDTASKPLYSNYVDKVTRRARSIPDAKGKLRPADKMSAVTHRTIASRILKVAPVAAYQRDATNGLSALVRVLEAWASFDAPGQADIYAQYVPASVKQTRNLSDDVADFKDRYNAVGQMIDVRHTIYENLPNSTARDHLLKLIERVIEPLEDMRTRDKTPWKSAALV